MFANYSTSKRRTLQAWAEIGERPSRRFDGRGLVGRHLVLALSAQVLQEFYVQATRTSRPDPITHRQAVRLIESFHRFPVQDITTAIVMAALDTRERFQLSYWDSAIIEASRAMSCTEVLSEDMGDGQDYAGVRVTNPFR